MICSGGQNDVIDGLLSPELWSISLQCSSISHNIHDTGTHRCAFIIDVFYYSAFLRAVSYAAQCAHAQCLIPRSVFYRALSYAAQCLMSHSVLCPTYLGGAAGLRGVPGEQGQRTVYGQLQQRPKQPKRWPNHQRKVRPFRLFHDS